MSIELPSPRWLWEKTNPDRGGAAGDLGKLFKNTRINQPDLLEDGAPPPTATLLAREVIQNAWDSALERREEYEKLIAGDPASAPPPPPDFRISFNYRNAKKKAEKRRLADRLGLRELKKRADRVGEPRDDERRKLGLDGSSHHCFDSIAGKAPLTQLLIDEQGTTGMYGPWRGEESKLYLALLAVGYTPKDRGQGGSYGYGKAALIKGSRIRTLIAYTCFRERDDDPGVTRRLLGMTYWGHHRVDGASFTGFARLGQPHETNNGEVRRPFENETADEIARQFGIKRRNANDPRELGTSILLVEPSVTPADLEKAVSRSWWPALEDGRCDGSFEVQIRTAAGKLLPPRRPRRDHPLNSFHDAYEIALQEQAAPEKRRKRFKFRGTMRNNKSDGTLGLVADPDDWSFPHKSKGGNSANNRSLVALLRKPRMVVSYHKVGRTPPFVRGVFVADESVNELLRKTEPKEHDDWQTTPDEEGADEEGAFDLAKRIKSRIKKKANAFRKEIKPPPQPAEKYRLTLFDREMRKLLGGTKSTSPGAGQRPVTIRFPDGPNLRRAPGGGYFVDGTVRVGLSETEERDSLKVELYVRYPLLEDGKPASESVKVTLTELKQLALVGSEGPTARFGGEIRRDSPIRFDFRTGAVQADWSGRLEVRVKPLVDEESASRVPDIP